MRKKLLLFLTWTIATTTALSQMNINGTIMYGNEWIDYDKTYFKIKLSEDGIYRINAAELIASDVPIGQLQGSDLQLFHHGKQVPIRVSTNGNLGDGDYIDFYGRKNRGELDRHVYDEPDIRQINPDYSLITDTSSYYLTWQTGANERMEEIANDLSGNLPNKEEYYWAVEEQIFSDYHHKPVRTEARFTSLDIGEGFGRELNQTNSFDLNPTQVYSGGPSAELQVRFATNQISHIAELSLGNDVIRTDTFSGYDMKQYTDEIDVSRLSSTTNVSLVGKASENDRYIVSKVRLTYPRNFSFDGESEVRMLIPANGNDQYIEIENFGSQSNQVLVYNITEGYYLNAESSEGLVKFILPASTDDQEIILTHADDLKSASTIEQISFVDYTNLDPEFIILTGNKIYNDDSQGENMVEAYASYRRSEEGGGFNVAVVSADELYNQFGYGVDRHFLAIKNFSQYVASRWQSAEYVFILGKGLEYNINRTQEQYLENERQKFSIPTFGSPGSDNLLFSQPGSSAPVFALGRIAARDASEIKLYLDKVKLHENPIEDNQTIEDQSWRKRVMHLSGGDGAVLQRVIGEYLDSMALHIEEGSIGADVTTFRKTSSDAVQTSTSAEITKVINDGTSIITFFGHASLGVFDFSIDQPEDWDNYGRYPLLMSLGCLSGDIHSVTKSLSINYVLEADRAAIAFLASSGNAFVNPSFNSGLDVYESLSGDMYGESIGKVILASLRKRDSNKTLNVQSLNEQLTLHGDPAVRLHKATEGADLVVDFESLTTEPAIVSTNLDSFNFLFEVFNLGKTVTGDYDIELTHLGPSGEVLLIDTINVNSPKFSELISVTYPMPIISATGKNTIKLRLDINNSISEFPNPSAEANNFLMTPEGLEQEFCFYILDSGAKPVSPREYSIVTDNNPVLRASTSNAFLELQKYIIQIDTTELFNSPLLEVGEITQGGGLIEWSPSITLEEETVYYWRIRPETTIGREASIWETSSFVYLPNGQPGWNQSHYFQTRSAEFDGLDLPASRQLQFDTSGFNISIWNKNDFSDQERGLQFNFETFALSVRPWNFMQEGGIAVIWGDAITGGFRLNDRGEFGSIDTGSGQRFFGYKTTEAGEREKLINFLTNIIPDKSFVYIIGVANDAASSYGPELWEEDKATLGTTLFEIFENEGAQKIRSLDSLGSVPYNFVYVKGEGGDTAEGVAGASGLIKTDYFVTRKGTDGKMKSTLIGPAKSYDTFLWEEREKEATDFSLFRIYTIDKEGNETLFNDGISEKETDLSSIDANIYPYLRIEYFARDDSQRTSPELDYWRIYFEELPDAALNPQALLTFQSDTLEQGQNLLFEMAVDNISTADMDSLLVHYKLLNTSNQETIEIERVEPLPESGRLNLRYERGSLDLKGKYQFSVEINPDEDQAERYAFNNFAIKEFFVQGDNKNPLLDVTFDGVHLLDGDIVSSKPCILIELDDDNKFLPISDVSAFDVSMIYPGQSQAIPISLSDPNLRFTPATDENKKATLEYKPELEEGIHKLLVQGKDASGNDSASKKYEISFEVVKARRVTNVLNYPNPFSSSTQFVFTLTGQVPDVFTIRIMTLSGKVVKEITKEELGEIRLGTNKTKYRWDGTDDYGNQLGNGVYLYKVIMNNDNGEDYEKMINESEKYFTKGIGKMVLLR